MLEKIPSQEEMLCALYAKEDCFGFMVILGQAERSNRYSMI